MSGDTKFAAQKVANSRRVMTRAGRSPTAVPAKTKMNTFNSNVGTRNPFGDAQAKEYVISSGRSKRGA
jgi:hypothetical protein